MNGSILYNIDTKYIFIVIVTVIEWASKGHWNSYDKRVQCTLYSTWQSAAFFKNFLASYFKQQIDKWHRKHKG